MSKWPMIALGGLGKIVTGATPLTSRDDYYGGGILFATPAELDAPEPIVRTPRTLSVSGAGTVRMVPKDAVLVCCIGSLGKIGIAGQELATNQQINSIVFDQKRVWPRFGLHACRQLRPRLEAMAPATTVAIVSKSKFAALEIPVPPLPEQKHIAAILDQADELRRKRRRGIERLSSLSQAVFYETFGDPASNPKGWPVGIIGDLTASTQYGTSSKAGEKGTLPILRMGNILASGDFDFRDLKFIDLSTNEFDKHTVRDGDILFNRTNSPDLVGKTGVYRGDKIYAYAGYLVRLRTNDQAVPEYVGSFLNSAFGKKTLRGMCKAIIGMANINAQELRSIPIPIVPIALQKEFQARIFALQSALPSYREHSKCLDTLFASLQHRAFRGELTAKTAERELAEAV